MYLYDSIKKEDKVKRNFVAFFKQKKLQSFLLNACPHFSHCRISDFVDLAVSSVSEWRGMMRIVGDDDNHGASFCAVQ